MKKKHFAAGLSLASLSSVGQVGIGHMLRVLKANWRNTQNLQCGTVHFIIVSSIFSNFNSATTQLIGMAQIAKCYTLQALIA